MNAFAVLVVLAAEMKFSGYAQQSRGLFEKLIDIKVEKDMLVLRADPKGAGAGRELFQLASGSFSGVGRIYVRYQGGGSSTSRGGSGSVTIRHELESGGAFEFNFQSPDGKESLILQQPSPGQLTVEYRLGKRSISFSQSQGKCQLRVRTGLDSMAASRATFTAVYRENPEAVQRSFIELLEAFFDDVPGLGYSPAPPGKVILRLKDGAQIVGELKLVEATLVTDYGALVLPRDEIRQIVFPGSEETVDLGNAGIRGGKIKSGEVVVVTKRFSPRGHLEVEEFLVATPYGDLKVVAGEVLNAVFGPPVEPGEPEDVGADEPAEETSG
jgi:hypothetical protein